MQLPTETPDKQHGKKKQKLPNQSYRDPKALARLEGDVKRASDKKRPTKYTLER